MRIKQSFSIRRKTRIAVAAVLLATLTFCVTYATGPYASSKPLTAVEELHKIIERIYFPDDRGCCGYVGDTDVAHGRYQIEDNLAPSGATSSSGYGGGSSGTSNCCDDNMPRLLGLFRKRLILNHNSKTLRDINELIDMIANRGTLPARLQRIEAKNAELEEKLHRPIMVSLEDVTFADFLELLRNELGIAIWVDERAFMNEDMDDPLEEAISLNLTELPAICALELLQAGDPLYDMKGYRFNNGVLEILPWITAKQNNYPRVYDVADLLSQGNAKTGKIDELIATFETMFVLVDENEGSFLMPFQNTLLVAYLPQHQHKQLEAALFAMRNGGQLPPLQQMRADLNRELYERLQQEVSIDFDGILFSEALDSLKEQTGLTFVANEKEFENEDSPYPLDHDVTLKLQNQSLESVLYFLMRQLDDADFIAWNGVVYIAPQVTCERKNEPYFFVYPVEQQQQEEEVELGEFDF